MHQRYYHAFRALVIQAQTTFTGMMLAVYANGVLKFDVERFENEASAQLRLIRSTNASSLSDEVNEAIKNMAIDEVGAFGTALGNISLNFPNAPPLEVNGLFLAAISTFLDRFVTKAARIFGMKKPAD